MILQESTEFKLFPHQEEVIPRLKSGSILYGDVGSGKTIAALSFYKKYYKDLVLVIITTAKKRDTGDWQNEMKLVDVYGIVDSWNNIQKYKNIANSFFIFDEQRVIGYSAWGKTFIKIAKYNKWILLSATPGDTWMDYMPVFIANGFYLNKSDFLRQHVEFEPYISFPKVKAYHNEGRLIKLRDSILVHMEMKRHTKRFRQIIYSSYDINMYNEILKKRWNVFENKPIENASELLQCLRKCVNTDDDRIFNAKVIIDFNERIIVFYNYNYELDILKNICEVIGREYYQWNGHTHQEIPDSKEWVYLVQYTAGSEGWNCTSTNVMLFYSSNYSYRVVEQCEGRIDRLNTTFMNLEYYILSSKSKIDVDILKTVEKKQKFNAVAWARRNGITW